jgi:hypothetical protein
MEFKTPSLLVHVNITPSETADVQNCTILARTKIENHTKAINQLVLLPNLLHVTLPYDIDHEADNYSNMLSSLIIILTVSSVLHT